MRRGDYDSGGGFRKRDLFRRARYSTAVRCRAAVLVLVILGSTAVAACSGGGSGDDATTTATPDPSGSASPTPSTTGSVPATPTASPTASGASPTPTGSPLPTPTPNVPQPTWTWIRTNVVLARCSGGLCHGVTSDASMEARTDLVNIATSKGTLCDGHVRVVPNSSATSYFYLKVTATPGCGVRMPKGGTALSQATQDAIKTWIDDGALDN